MHIARKLIFSLSLIHIGVLFVLLMVVFLILVFEAFKVDILIEVNTTQLLVLNVLRYKKVLNKHLISR